MSATKNITNDACIIGGSICSVLYSNNLGRDDQTNQQITSQIASNDLFRLHQSAFRWCGAVEIQRLITR